MSITAKGDKWCNIAISGTTELFDNEGLETKTSKEQDKVEKSIERLFNLFYKKAEIDPEEPLLLRDVHLHFLKQHLCHLPTGYECLDASRPWLCYWITHSLVMLNYSIDKEQSGHIATFLARCQNEDGGFGGGPGQMSHLAPTYAAVNTLCSLGTPEAYNVIDREKLKQYLRTVRQPNGAFCMHVGGEVDVRGVYCALSVSLLTNIYSEDLFTNSAEWIILCQTYEGGFSGVPGMEAHGGYAFCAIAALSLLRKVHLCDVRLLLVGPLLKRWAVNRQMRYEGGFQGRTNKLVDGCYSFWQGGMFPIIQGIICMQESTTVEVDQWLFNSEALQQYILVCCQHPSGGLIDKPSKARDIYHTCYTLSGLAVAQNLPSGRCAVLGSTYNLLEPVHPLYNIGLTRVQRAQDFFQQLPVPL